MILQVLISDFVLLGGQVMSTYGTLFLINDIRSYLVINISCTTKKNDRKPIIRGLLLFQILISCESFFDRNNFLFSHTNSEHSPFHYFSYSSSNNNHATNNCNSHNKSR